jgi:hypothetical protein
MTIEGDPSFRDGSSKVHWRRWLIIYKEVLKVPWDDIAFQFRQKTGARIGASQLGRWRKGEQKGHTASKHRQGGSRKAKSEGSSSRRGERVRRKKTRLVSHGRGQSRLTSSEDTTGTEEEYVHSSEEDADPRGGLGDWNDDSENDEDGGEDEKSGDDGPADPTSENSGEAAELTSASLIKPQGGRRNPSRGCNDGKRYSNLSP